MHEQIELNGDLPVQLQKLEAMATYSHHFELPLGWKIEERVLERLMPSEVVSAEGFKMTLKTWIDKPRGMFFQAFFSWRCDTHTLEEAGRMEESQSDFHNSEIRTGEED